MINKLHFPRTSCNGAFAEVAIHWLSTMVSGWEKIFAEVAFHWLSTVVSGWEKIFAVVAFHWLSTVVSGWGKLSQKSYSIGYQPWFPDGERFSQKSHNALSPSPPHDFPYPFRIAIGFDTCLEALPTDSSLDSTSPARQTGGGCRLPTASASLRTACLRLCLPAVRTTEGPASTLGSSEIGSDKVILLHNNLRCSTHRRCLRYRVSTSVHSLPLCDIHQSHQLTRQTSSLRIPGAPHFKYAPCGEPPTRPYLRAN